MGIGIGADLITTVKEAAEQLGRIISSGLSNTDRQRVNIGVTSVLYHGVLNSTSWKPLYTASENTRAEIKEIVIANNESTSNKISVAIVPKGSTISDDHLFVPELTIDGKKYEKIVLTTSLIGGWKLYMRAFAANRLIVHISGNEIVN